MKFTTLDFIAFILVIIGGLNWGLVGLMDFNVVDVVFGVGSFLGRVVYILVGLSAIYLAIYMPKMERKG